MEYLAIEEEASVSPIVEEPLRLYCGTKEVLPDGYDDFVPEVDELEEDSEDRVPGKVPLVYSKMKVTELRDLLESRGLSKAGKKSILIERLERNDDNEAEEHADESAGGSADESAGEPTED